MAQIVTFLNGDDTGRLPPSIFHLIVAEDKDRIIGGQIVARKSLPDLVKQTRSARTVVRHDVNLAR